MPGLNSLPELSAYSRTERKEILEKARYEVFVRQKRTGQAGLFLVFSLVIGFILALAWQYWLGAGALTGFLVPVICLSIAGVLFRLFYGKMVHKGVRALLQQDSAQNPDQQKTENS